MDRRAPSRGFWFQYQDRSFFSFTVEYELMN
jgi:hypothetical protein